jgi:hypothetical protein
MITGARRNPWHEICEYPEFEVPEEAACDLSAFLHTLTRPPGLFR